MPVRLLRAKDDNRERFVYYPHPVAEVVELVDTTDSKSVAFAGLGVRVPPSVPFSRACPATEDHARVKSQLLHHCLQ